MLYRDRRHEGDPAEDRDVPLVRGIESSSRPGSEGLPGSAYLVKPTGSTFPMTRIAFTGSHAQAFNRTDSFVDAGQVRGAFRAGKYVYYGANGMLHRTAFDGTTFGPAADVNPYQDSPWNGLYPGHLPTFYTQDLPKVRGMFLANNRALLHQRQVCPLYWRYFQPQDSGVVSEQLHKASKPRAVSFTKPGGCSRRDGTSTSLGRAAACQGSRCVAPVSSVTRRQ